MCDILRDWLVEPDLQYPAKLISGFAVIKEPKRIKQIHRSEIYVLCVMSEKDT